MRLHFSLNISKKTVILVLTPVIVLSGLVLYQLLNKPNPIPKNIQAQLSYKTIYPANTDQITPNSYKYQVDQKNLVFDVEFSGNKIIFTEQPAPESLGSTTQAYYPVLGVHPYAQFQTGLGVVALTKFYHTGSLKPFGESGILASGGTLLIAHCEKHMTNEQWKALFESLKISR